MPALNRPLVWIDLEMTGLDPNIHTIVEVAVIITDGDLEQVIEGPDLVIHATEEELARMDEVVLKMHTKSGLLELVRASEISIADAEKAILEFLVEHVPEPRAGVLAGNSIHSDRSFLLRYMPAVAEHLHYRLVDVSTIKELARRWYPEAVKSAPDKDGDHRALADIRESIAELRHYRAEIFR